LKLIFAASALILFVADFFQPSHSLFPGKKRHKNSRRFCQEKETGSAGVAYLVESLPTRV